MSRRYQAAGREIRELANFDYRVVNRRGELDKAVAEVEAIITAKKCRVVPREIAL